MFFEEETKDTHGNMDDYDLDIEQGESVSWDKLLDDKDELDEPAVLETADDSNEDDIAEKLLNMDDDSFDAFVVKQQQNAPANAEASEAANEIDFDEFLLDDLDDETEDALKKAVKNDLSSDNNYEPEVLQEDETLEEDEDVFDFIEENEENIENIENVQQIEQAEPQNAQNIQQEIAQINDLEEEEDETVSQFLHAYDDEVDEPKASEVKVAEDDSQTQAQFAETTPDVPTVVENPQGGASLGAPKTQNSNGGNFAQKPKSNEPKKQNSSLTTIALLIVLLGAGGYYAYTNYGDKLNFGGTSDSTMDIAQDNSLMADTQAGIGGEPSDLPAPTGDAQDIPTPPVDVDAPLNPQADANAQATKSVSKAIEQGRTKISKDNNANKTSIQIVTTGRLNPFVPVGNLNNIGFITSPKIDILPPSETLGEPDPLLDKLMSIKVSGILYDGVNSSAVINLGGVDYFVQKGDKIDSFTVVDITKTSVAIKEKNNIFSASIGQSFTSGTTIDGQTQIQRHNNTIIRQYTTASDINVNPSGN